ncbi:5'-3' exonuclease [Syntrophomonas palmitatica]|uniref:5'-3' exonuclease n=1 Tax=Syntrophomonas palmitatica TaxID=402877 RepID=UPI0009F8AA7C|nr:5'-3' exonuclease H3TH domain-containing protein [Syntrophomonas palmitatica]
MQTSYGVFTNGVFAMCKTLMRLVETCKPDYMAVAWDISRETFRRKMYPDYKANRVETAPELKSQYILMQEILKTAGIAQFMDDNLEADDFLGCLSTQFESREPVFILTKDQDVLQLISDRTRVWLITNRADELKKTYQWPDHPIPSGAFEFTPLIIKEVYGVYPDQIIDKKALEGDSSDNIPGVKGIGEKVAIPLIQEFGSVEEIYKALEDEEQFKQTCKDLGVRSPIKALKEGKEMAFLSKTLATIKTDSLPVQLTDLKLNINWDALNLKFEELEFRSLVTGSVPKQTQASLF